MNGQAYLNSVIAETARIHATEPEFLQTVSEVLAPLAPVIDRHPEYIEAGVVERLVEPERIIQFRSTWTDDSGKVNVNRSYRVQYNSALGPYKGGLRFAPSVNLSVMKFLGLEQTLKNSLSDLPLGGAKGGSDFDPVGKSDREIMRFCQSFMTELYRHIGDNSDIPAGDLGVGSREIGYLFGMYKSLANKFTGVITGKPLSSGGSSVRAEATGFGACYFAAHVLNSYHDTLDGKRISVSGFGNVAWGTCTKMMQLGGKVITISGPDGYVYDPDGVATQEKLDYLLEMRSSNRNKAQDYADRFRCQFFPGQKPWTRSDIDIIMPCATQNELTLDDAKIIVKNGIRYVFEVSNMSSTNEAIDYFQSNGVVLAPSKAVNAGGVIVSCFEMSQNASHIYWPAAEVDEKLQIMMQRSYNTCLNFSRDYGYGNNLVAGANIAGFKKLADAMVCQGITF